MTKAKAKQDLKVKEALLQTLYNCVGKVHSFYDYKCPSCDLEEEEAECTCKQGFVEFRKAQDSMFATYFAIKEHNEAKNKQ